MQRSKRSSQAGGIDILFHLPDQVNVVGHDHEAINKHSVIIYVSAESRFGL